MRNYYAKLTFFLALVFTISAFSQNRQSVWTKVTKNQAESNDLVFRKSTPEKANFYQLDITEFKQQLQNAPQRDRFLEDSNVLVDFPNTDGTFETFKVYEASVMAAELQSQYSDIRSYVGQSVENPETLIRFSVTPQGLHTMTLSSETGTQFIDPYTRDSNAYIVYAKRDLPFGNRSFVCEVDDEGLIAEDLDIDVMAQRNANDGKMRTFRLALACTIEYASFHWTAAGLTAADSVADRKDAVLAAMVVTMTRVNGVYEKELSITMTLVPNNLNIIYIVSDSFDNNNAGTLINQSQTVIDGAIGSANYDIGHTFSTGGGGLAQLNSPCVNGSKARGITGLPQPVGDAYDIDFVCHEMGHQYGGPHTFNGSTGNCSGSNRSPSNAYEPGSGTTIMAYAGICAPQNVQGNSDAYFHQISLQRIWANVSAGNSQCGVQTDTGNTAPTADAGASYTVPISTPYMLTASSTDGESTDTHTYTWEQWDLGPAGAPTETTATGPLVRSFEGTTNPTRYIPNIPDLLQSGGSTDWEKLVSISRAINFRVTVRDNDPRGGQTATDIMTVTTSTSSGPFAVTSQSTPVTWSAGNTETITWNVAGTNAGAVNTPNVDILLSTDGGMTFDTVLASAVPNNGSADIIVPDVLAEDCLVMVKGSGNIFFNINTSRIAIGYNITAGDVCETYTFNLNQTLGTNATAFEQFGVNIPDSGTITDVNFKYDITTPNIGQLHMAIVSAGGTRAYAHNANGQCASGANMQVVWDSEAAGEVVCGQDPTTGTALPAPGVGEPLSAIYGEEMNGTWVLMAANIGATNMVFNFADVEICTSGFVAVLAPERITQTTVEVDVLSSATIDDTHLVVASPNTPNPSDIEFTLTVLPTEGTVYLNGAALGINDTFTQADVNSGNVTYTTTSSVDTTDGFRVDVDDNNDGTLPNLLVNIQVIDGLSVDEFSFDVFNVYPNPTSGEVTVMLSSYEDVSVSLFDIQGRKVYNNYFENTTTFNRTIDLSSASTGIYMLQVTSGSKTATKKLIIR
ncbi:reprolysin-like metallopeptidase [Hanstruepera ponticola]|uniref:reprolysin-like metallopeptidase n=1 Tax=Hanstruepera ponticola TaxID=2042995 RepID=UPI00177B0845|nr:zinc-dependent metalloprotease family protein [Hanstruepera ponticola]